MARKELHIEYQGDLKGWPKKDSGRIQSLVNKYAVYIEDKHMIDLDDAHIRGAVHGGESENTSQADDHITVDYKAITGKPYSAHIAVNKDKSGIFEDKSTLWEVFPSQKSKVVDGPGIGEVPQGFLAGGIANRKDRSDANIEESQNGESADEEGQDGEAESGAGDTDDHDDEAEAEAGASEDGDSVDGEAEDGAVQDEGASGDEEEDVEHEDNDEEI